MKRALAWAAIVVVGAVGAAGCGRSAAPVTSFEIVIRVEDEARGAEALDREVVVPIEHALATYHVPGHAHGRATAGSATIVVTPDLGIAQARLADEVQRALLLAASTLPRDELDPPTFRIHELPETSLWFAGSGVGAIVETLAQLPTVSQVDECGVRSPADVVVLEPERAAGLGVTLEDVRVQIAAAAAGADLRTRPLAGHDPPLTLADVATVQRGSASPVCTPSRSALTVRVRGHALDRAAVTEAAAAAQLAPLEAAAIYISRVRFASPEAMTRGGPALLAREASAGSGVAWAFTEAVEADASARLVIGMTTADAAGPATAVAERAAVDAQAMIEAAGGATELEAVIAPGDGSEETASRTAEALVAKLRAAGAVAGCDGCAELARSTTTYVIDTDLVRRYGVAPEEVAHGVASLAPGGAWVGARRLVVGWSPGGAEPARAVYLRAAGGERVPLAALVRVQLQLEHPRLRDDGAPVATVWVRAATGEAARAALSAALPAGTPIGPRRLPPD